MRQTHMIRVIVVPDRETTILPIRRSLLIDEEEFPVARELALPELGRPLPVLMVGMQGNDTCMQVWCSGTPHDIVFLKGVNEEWEDTTYCPNC